MTLSKLTIEMMNQQSNDALRLHSLAKAATTKEEKLAILSAYQNHLAECVEVSKYIIRDIVGGEIK